SVVASCCCFNPPPTPQVTTLSLHDALPICEVIRMRTFGSRATSWRTVSTIEVVFPVPGGPCTSCMLPGNRLTALRTACCWLGLRSEEHTELQSRFDLVCRLLLEKKKLLRPA